jgi:hydrogenase maturation protein HypF
VLIRVQFVLIRVQDTFSESSKVFDMNKTILALGADIKNRFLLAKGNSFRFGPDIGDLSETENYELFKREVRKAVKRFKPDIIGCDLHPGYFSSRFAKELNAQCTTHNAQLIQHHHAHIASVMQEHRLKGKVLGVSFDGTGFGSDGNFWGGEFLLVNRSKFKRLAYLKYRMMPGGDKVVYEPWRMVLSILGGRALPFLKKVRKKDQQLLLAMLAKRINSPLTSSAGRLFDAAAALLGLGLYASYEAQGPIRLEGICHRNISSGYRFATAEENGCSIVDTDGLFLGMLKDLKQNKDKGLIAAKFHNSIAKIIIDTAKNLAGSCGIKNVALSGGVFQNNLLRHRAIQGISAAGLNVFTNINTPLNDFNISLGQYYVCK